MNKRRGLLIAALTVFIAGAVVFGLMRSREEVEQKAEQANVDSTQSTATAPLAQPGESTTDYTQKGVYTEYDHVEVAHAPGRKLLFFHAAWCPQCQQLDIDINKQNIPANMTIFKVNYDTQTDLKQKYGVTLQTTVVEIDDQNNVVKKHVAYDDPTLAGVLKVLGQ